MHQFGWPDYACRVWHFVLEEDEYPLRYLNDKESALMDLANEG